MNKISIIISIMCIFFGSSCKNTFHFHSQTSIGNNDVKFVFDNYIQGISDSFRDASLKFKNGNNSKLFFINQKGNIWSYTECKQNGGYVHGGTQMVFKKGRLRILRFNDSNGKITGPLFFYKRNGKLKHIFIYQANKYLSTYYTSSPKSIKNDIIYIE